MRDQDADLQPISITSVSRSPEWHVVAGSQIGIYLEPLRRSILRHDLRQSLTPDSHFQSSGAPCCSHCTFDVLVSQSCIQTTTTPSPLSLSPFSLRRGSKPTKIQKSRKKKQYLIVALLYFVWCPPTIQTHSSRAEFTIGIANCKCFAIRTNPVATNGGCGTFNPDGQRHAAGRQKIAE